VNQIKAFFIRKAVKKQLRSERNAQLPSLNSVKNLVVLIDNKQFAKLDDFKRFFDQKFPVTECFFMVVRSKKAEQNITDGKVMLVGANDFSVFGKVKNEKLNDFITQKADLLLDLSSDSALIGNFLLAFKNAGFKVGFRSDSDDPTDLLLKIPHKVDEQESLVVFWEYFLKLNGENHD